jgi:hypothetical protein
MTAELSGMQEPFEPEFHFSEGQRVRIVEGPFTEFVGRVSESHREQQKVIVLISYFGKETPFVFDFPRSRKSNRFYHRRKASTILREDSFVATTSGMISIYRCSSLRISIRVGQTSRALPALATLLFLQLG